MTIDKAIEILEDYQADMGLTPATDLRDAFDLGIEALRLIKALRDYEITSRTNCLPGESKWPSQ